MNLSFLLLYFIFRGFPTMIQKQCSVLQGDLGTKGSFASRVSGSSDLYMVKTFLYIHVRFYIYFANNRN